MQKIFLFLSLILSLSLWGQKKQEVQPKINTLTEDNLKVYLGRYEYINGKKELKSILLPKQYDALIKAVTPILGEPEIKQVGYQEGYADVFRMVSWKVANYESMDFYFDPTKTDKDPTNTWQELSSVWKNKNGYFFYVSLFDIQHKIIIGETYDVPYSLGVSRTPRSGILPDSSGYADYYFTIYKGFLRLDEYFKIRVKVNADGTETIVGFAIIIPT